MPIVNIASPLASDRGKYKLLVVDDAVEIIEEIRLRFEFEGFEVVEADNGRDALRICANAHPDVIITDVRLPFISGPEFLRAFHKGKSDSDNLPVFICMSGYTDIGLSEALELGASAFFRKPMSLGDMVATVRSFLRKRELLLALREEASGLKRCAHATRQSLDQIGMQFVHELNNHVTGIVSSLERVLLPSNESKMLADPKMRSLVEMAQRKGWELNEIINTVHALYSEQGILASVIAVSSLTAACVEFSSEYLNGHCVGLEVTPSQEDFWVHCSLGAVRQIFFNLVKNSTEAMVDKQMRKITLSIHGDENFCYFTLQDYGPGIADAARTAVLEPRYSTKAENLGLGLSFCKKAAEAFGGFLRVEQVKHGAEICLAIPRVSEPT